MGFKDVDWAYGLDLPSGQKVVLAALCHRTDDKTHQTFVGRKMLAQMVGMTDRGISKILAALDDAGVISRQERRRRDGYRDTDLITVNLACVESQGNEVQGNQEHVNEVPVNDVPISGEQDSDLRGTTFEARESKDSLVTQRSLIDHSFERAWVNWPNRVKKKDSLKAFTKVASTRELDELVADIIRFGNAYAASTEKQFVPALCVWLAGERWTDELPTASQSRGGARQQNALDLIARMAALDAAHSGEFSPGHVPSDGEWKAALAAVTEKPAAKPIAELPARPSETFVFCDKHEHPDRYLILDGACAECARLEQTRHKTHEAA